MQIIDTYSGTLKNDVPDIEGRGVHKIGGKN